MVKNVNILEFLDHIWNHHDKYIQMSTNMPGIGSLIREIDVKMSKFEKATNAKVLNMNRYPRYFGR